MLHLQKYRRVMCYDYRYVISKINSELIEAAGIIRRNCYAKPTSTYCNGHTAVNAKFRKVGMWVR